MNPDPSSPKLLSPRERAVRALGLTSRELLNLTSLGDLAAFTEQRVADAIADAEDAVAKPLEARLAQLEQEQATLKAQLGRAEGNAMHVSQQAEEDQGHLESAKWARILEIERRGYDRLAICADHRDKASGRCIVCDGEYRGKAAAEAALGEIRQALQQMTEQYEDLVARVGPLVPGAAPTGSTAARNEP